MSFLTGLANLALTKLSPDYEKAKRALNDMGEDYKFRGMIAIIVGVASAVFGVAAILFGSTAGLIPLALSLPFFYMGYNNNVMGENIKQVALNPMDYLDEDKCYKKIAEGTVLFDFRTREVTHLIVHGRKEQRHRH